MTPQAEAQLKSAHNVGLQRILSFENPGGGFGWYAGHGTDVHLAAYAAMYLADLGKVYEYDRAVLDRSVAWLEKNQAPGGSWGGDVRATAYAAWALRRAGREDTVAMGRALEFLRRNPAEDAYVLALAALADPAPANLDKLARLAKDGAWTTPFQSWTRGRGMAANVETTALAVLALARHNPALADQGAAFLVRSKDPHGTWGSTQATVLALQALAASGGGARDKVAASLRVNGREIPNAFSETDRPQSFDISPHLRTGANDITVETSARVNVQVAGRHYVPWGTDDLLRGVEGLNLQVSYDRLEVRVGETVTCTVKVECDSFMVIADVSIPPGFTVDRSGLDDLVRRRVVDKVAQTGRNLTFYLPGKSAVFGFKLKPRYPARVAVPRSVVYEYYAPDRRVISPPQEIAVGP